MRQLQQVCLVFDIVQALLAGSNVTEVLRDIGVGQFPVVSGESLAQLLYAYLVQWIGKLMWACSIVIIPSTFVVSWINSYALGADSGRESSCISVVYAPGPSFYDQYATQSSTLTALVTRYANEILHNLYCSRLFVWEQVGVFIR